MAKQYKPRFEIACALVLSLSTGALAQTAPETAPAATEQKEDLTNLNLDDLMDVKVTTASKKSESLFNVPAAIFVISADDIKRSGAANIPEALRLAPGVNVARVDSQKYAVSIRGFNDTYAARLLVLIDGRSIYNTFFGGVYWEDQQYRLEDIERIEVIRGPGGTVWGANAINGIVNIITKSSSKTLGFSASLEAGTELNETTGSVRYGGTVGKGTFRVTGLGFSRANSETRNGKKSDDWDGGRLSFRYDGDQESSSKLSITGDVHKFDMTRTGSVTFPAPPFWGSKTGTAESKGGHLLARLESAAKDGSSTWLQGYYDFEDRGFSSSTFSKVSTIDLDYQHSLAPMGAHTLTFGAGYRHISDEFTGSMIVSEDKKDYSLSSVFLQDIFHVNDKTTVTLGTKALNNVFTGWEFQPNVRVAVAPSEHQAYWFSLGRAVQLPSRSSDALDVFTGVVPLQGGATGEVRLIGNRNLDAGTLTAAEVGFRSRVSSNMTLDLTAFHNSYDNLTGFVSGAPIPTNTPFPHVILPQVLQTVGKATTYGVEASSRYQASKKWRMDFNYSYFNAKYPSNFTTSAPKHQFGALSTLELTSKLSFDQQVSFTGADTGSNTAAFAQATLQLRYKASDGLDFAIGGRNLGSKRFYQARDLSFDKTSYTEPEFYARATWKF